METKQFKHKMSKIEWTEKTWNPIVSGCSMVSEGCTNCYAMKMSFRLAEMGQEKYKGLTKKTEKGNIVWNGKIKIDLDDKALFEPLKRKKPTMYFVNSMTDLFHEDVPFEAIDKIMGIIALSPQHTFQILTKRPERMKEYFENPYLYKKIRGEVKGIDNDYSFPLIYLPLPNLWLGVSVENQEQANKRIPYLLETEAKVRFLSCEPLLGKINLDDLTQINTKKVYDCLEGEIFEWDVYPDDDSLIYHSETGKIDWVIVGGESGTKNVRPMHPDWVRGIRNQCKDANVPFFFKQWGEWMPADAKRNYTEKRIECSFDECLLKVGKKNAGRLLDGVEHNEMPII